MFALHHPCDVHAETHQIAYQIQICKIDYQKH